MAGLWFEDLTEGREIDAEWSRTVTETDNVLFSSMTMNVQPLHLDAEFAAGTEFGKPLVNSIYTLGLMIGMSVHNLTNGTLVANLGMTDVTFPAPVFVGDTLYAESLVVGVRPSKSRPGEGVVELEHTARNQDGVVVARCQRAMLVRNRPKEQS